MARVIPKEGLEKIGTNLGRLAVFFSSRVEWKVEGPEKEALGEILVETSKAAETVGATLKANTIRFQPRKNPALADQLEPDESMSADVLGKYLGFYKQVGAWLNNQAGGEIPEDAATVAQGVHGSLCTAEEALRLILGVPRKQAERESTAPAAAEPELRPLVRDPATLDPQKSRLALESSFEQPLLETKDNFTELSAHGQEVIATYLAENDIELDDFQLRQFHDKVKRWILATPENQILVLKVGPYQLEPYSSYIIQQSE